MAFFSLATATDLSLHTTHHAVPTPGGHAHVQTSALDFGHAHAHAVLFEGKLQVRQARSRVDRTQTHSLENGFFLKPRKRSRVETNVR